MTAINKQRFLAELSKLLSFMSSRDRQAIMDKYTAMFDEAGDEDALMRELGTPTKIAIGLAGDYVPSPMGDLPADPGQDTEDPADSGTAAGAQSFAFPPELFGGEDAVENANENAAESSAATAQRAEPQEPDGPASEQPADTGAPEGTPQNIPGLEYFTLDDASEPDFGPENVGEESGSDPAREEGFPEPEEITKSPESSGPVFAPGAYTDGPLPFETNGHKPQYGEKEDAAQDKRPVFEGNAPLPEFFAEQIISEPDDEESRRVKPAATVIYTIFAVILGLPVTLILIAVGLPFIAVGGAAIAAAVSVFLAVTGLTASVFVGTLSLVSDVLLCGGAALIVIAVGLLILWLGLFISISLAKLFIGGAVLRLGRRLCLEKEADGE